jgi:hypothetical protein
MPAGQKRGLWPFQPEGDLEIPVGGHGIEIVVPRFARVDARLVVPCAGQQIPGAFDVFGGERPAIMPLDAAAQRHCQLGALFVPAPPRRQIRDDRLRAVLRDLLVEHHQIVEDPHHWAVYGERRFLEHRHAGRAVKMTRVQDAALLLRQSRRRGRRPDQQRTRRHCAPA